MKNKKSMNEAEETQYINILQADFKRSVEIQKQLWWDSEINLYLSDNDQTKHLRAKS